MRLAIAPSILVVAVAAISQDRDDILQFAFVNGVSWEDVPGIWNGIAPLDAGATRAACSVRNAHRVGFSSPLSGNRCADVALRTVCRG
jgi:hypothetical protein